MPDPEGGGRVVQFYLCPECGSINGAERFCALHPDQKMVDRGELRSAVLLPEPTKEVGEGLREALLSRIERLASHIFDVEFNGTDAKGGDAHKLVGDIRDMARAALDSTPPEDEIRTCSCGYEGLKRIVSPNCLIHGTPPEQGCTGFSTDEALDTCDDPNCPRHTDPPQEEPRDA